MTALGPKPGQNGPAPLHRSLKQGFAQEEGSRGPSDKHEVKRKRKRGPMGGAFAALPRMHTFKNKPFHKTGTDEDTLIQGDERLRVIVVGGNEEVGRNCTLLEYGNDIIIIDIVVPQGQRAQYSRRDYHSRSL